MLLIRNGIDHQSDWPAERHTSFLKGCQTYIGELKATGNLISAQPMVREGKLLSGSNDEWNISPFNEGREVIVGYYHVRAENLDEAVSIAKRNPEFEFSTTARVEVRPIKMAEGKTGFVYPK